MYTYMYMYILMRPVHVSGTCNLHVYVSFTQEPIEVKLGRSVHTRRRNSIPRLSLAFDKVYYVPLLQSLQLLLSQSAIFKEVCH